MLSVPPATRFEYGLRSVQNFDHFIWYRFVDASNGLFPIAENVQSIIRESIDTVDHFLSLIKFRHVHVLRGICYTRLSLYRPSGTQLNRLSLIPGNTSPGSPLIILVPAENRTEAKFNLDIFRDAFVVVGLRSLLSLMATRVFYLFNIATTHPGHIPPSATFSQPWMAHMPTPNHGIK